MLSNLDVPDATGLSVRQRYQEIVEYMLEKNPGNVIQNPDKLAELIHTHKKEVFAPAQKRTKEQFRLTVARDSRVTSRCEKNIEVLESLGKLTKKQRETRLPFKPLQGESRFWGMVGVGFPENEVMLLDMTISGLVREKNLTEVRFFGKIVGTEADYYVLESGRYFPDAGHKERKEKFTMPDAPRRKIPVDVQAEPPNKGINRHSYWVCSHPGAEWVMLPDATPQQVNAARDLNKYFTGDLDAQIGGCTYPAFPGTEREYLRATLGRIAAATTVSPAGALEPMEPEDEEDDDEERDEEEPPVKFTEQNVADGLEEGIQSLANTEAWVHHYMHIMKNGRAKKIPEKEINEDEEDEPEVEEEEEPEEPEEEMELMKPIASDKLFHKKKVPVEKNPEEDEEEEPEPEEDPDEKPDSLAESNWDPEADEVDPEDLSVQRTSAWTALCTNDHYKAHGVIKVKSNRWPGAYAYAAEGGKVWGNIYVGYGLKASCFSYAPQPAPVIQGECADIVMKVDPDAKLEKLVRRGEEIPEADEEDPVDEDEDEEGEED